MKSRHYLPAYRAERRNLAKALKLNWRLLGRETDGRASFMSNGELRSHGTVWVVLPRWVSEGGKP